ncbi:hypothetical protein RDI58_026707 [Solanum bulbocastanum]|uniref:Uncharacterized protein n=1 Tax=Solanum bulbocastanum TaxID=147425 RepID=A0AAN8Y1F5_SOLBU
MKVKVKTGEKGDEPLSLVSMASSNQTKWRSFSPSWLLCTIAEKKRPRLMHWVTCVKTIQKETTTCLWTKVALELWDMFGLAQ